MGFPHSLGNDNFENHRLAFRDELSLIAWQLGEQRQFHPLQNRFNPPQMMAAFCSASRRYSSASLSACSPMPHATIAPILSSRSNESSNLPAAADSTAFRYSLMRLRSSASWPSAGSWRRILWSSTGFTPAWRSMASRASEASRHREPCVVHRRVADSPDEDSPPARDNPRHPLSRSERFPIRAAELPAASLHLDGRRPG